MAERIQVELVDDIDGSPAQQSISFALDGVTYEIDLSDRHAQQLRAVFGRYIPRARAAGTEKSDKTAKSEKPEKSSRQQREDQQSRRANRQLTEQIRGAARRTRERLNQRDDESDEQQTPAAASEPQDAEPQEAPTLPVSKRQPEKSYEQPASEERVGAVSLPQFSAAE